MSQPRDPLQQETARFPFGEQETAPSSFVHLLITKHQATHLQNIHFWKVPAFLSGMKSFLNLN